MKNRVFIYSHKPGSAGARCLSEELGVKRIRHRESRYAPRVGDVLINWGASELPFHTDGVLVINQPESVGVAVNKLTAFRELSKRGVSVPRFTQCLDLAYDWCSDGVGIVARSLLSGSGGAGISLVSDPEDLFTLPGVKLYVEYITKTNEYRVHVSPHDGVIAVQRKARGLDVPDDLVNWQIRNHHNGFVFARNEDHNPPERVIQVGEEAVNALGLDFGAADVIWNKKRGEAYVLEVNTAPGLHGETLTDYGNLFRKIIGI
jgi:glutathione synthase/RimK-type ligase-like ATP-grasp enzyme